MDINQQDLALTLGTLHLQILDLQKKLALALAEIDALKGENTANLDETSQ